MNNKTAIVLFSDDFRINDNPALFYASKNYENIIPLYIYQEDYLGRKIGAASKVFLHKVLESFNSLLKKEYGVNLIIRKGNRIDVIKEILNQIPLHGVYFNHSYTLKQIQDEQLIRNELKHLDVRSFKAKLLFEPWEIKTQKNEYFKVFTPFSKECIKKIDLIQEDFPKPLQINNNINLKGISLEELSFLPKNEGNWYENILKNWNFDHYEIEHNFMDFINQKVNFYSENRNIPAKNGNANISPYLRFGMLSPKFCFQAASIMTSSYHNQFNLELLWREFAYHVAYYNHNIVTQELKEEYKEFIWDESPELLKKWQQGKTGFDIIDAGMNELWKTGVMHNRVRMIAASFLIKDLLINWRLGEQWFWDTLVDADPAINPFSWQWVFGSGFDAAPYFRIFNPDLQKERFDSNETYCKKWLFKQNEKIVNHDFQRQIAMDRYKNLKH